MKNLYIILGMVISVVIVMPGQCMDLDLVPLFRKESQQRITDCFYKTLPALKLSEIGKHYCSLSMDCRNKIISHMSDELLMLHRIALWLPCDIQKEIFNSMLEDDAEAMDLFYNKKPVLEAFQLYHVIKNSIKTHESITRLYKMPQKNRDFVLRKLSPWYSPYVRTVIGIEEEFEINKLDKDSRQYLVGTKAILLDDDEADVLKCKKCGVIVVGGCYTWGTIAGGMLSVISCMQGVQFACTPIALKVSFGVASSLTPMLFLFGICGGMARICIHAKSITL